MLALELASTDVPFIRQAPITVEYRGHRIGEGRADFVVAGQLLVELKTVEAFPPVHKAQVIAYLRALRLQLGLLINFNVALLRDGIRRIVISSP